MGAVLFGSRFCAGSSFEFKASLNRECLENTVLRNNSTRVKNSLRANILSLVNGKWTPFWSEIIDVLTTDCEKSYNEFERRPTLLRLT
jgi:hypothetical protein